MTHSTSNSMAAPRARKKPSRVSRARCGLRATARAKSSVKRMSGSMASLAAAATGLVGSSEGSQLAKLGGWPPAAIWSAAAAAPAGSDAAPAPAGSQRNAR